MLIHLAAPNDSNGNPRRCFVLFNENGIGIAPTINVASQEYKNWLKIGC